MVPEECWLKTFQWKLPGERKHGKPCRSVEGGVDENVRNDEKMYGIHFTVFVLPSHSNRLSTPSNNAKNKCCVQLFPCYIPFLV